MLFGEIWTGRHLKRLNKLFGIRAPQSRLTLAQEVQPVVDIEDVDEQFERRILGDVRSYAGGTSVGASVGNLSVLELQYPATSSPTSLVVVEGVIISAPVSGGIGFYMSVPQLAGGFQYMSLDTRQAGTVGAGATGGVARLVTGVLAATPSQTLVLRATTAPLFIPLQCVLTVGTAMGITGNAANFAIDASFIWHEREADPVELKAL